MIDRLFPAVLTIALLAGGTLAIGSEFFSAQPAAARAEAVSTLPRVVVSGSVQRDAVVAQDRTSAAIRQQ